MGGVLEVRSQPAEGSCFSFSIDLAPATNTVNASTDQPELAYHLAHGQRVTALVEDDAADNRGILAQMLEKLGVDVVLANGDQEALAVLRSTLLAIVFMDMRMPVMDGQEAVQRIRLEWPHGRPVCIAVSASGITHDRRHYVDLGFDDFIGKPLRFQQITQCIERHLDVTFRTAPVDALPSKTGPGPADAPAVALSAEVRQRLRAAAELNALTGIEAILEELRSVDRQTRAFADYLNQFLARYDRPGLLAALEKT